MDEFESIERGRAWFHMSGRNSDDLWAVHTVDEALQKTNTAYLDVRDLASLARFVTQELARTATRNP